MPLMKIADVAGGGWLQEVTEAALALSADEDNSLRIMLLEDIRAIFDDFKSNQLQSSEIVGELVKLEHRPWPEFKRGQPLTTRQLAGLLSNFSVSPKQIWTGSRNIRGYSLEMFTDTWRRYLGDPPDVSARTLDAKDSKGSKQKRSARPKRALAYRKRGKTKDSTGSSSLANRSAPVRRKGKRFVYQPRTREQLEAVIEAHDRYAAELAAEGLH